MASNAQTILVIEDEEPIRRFLRASLAAEGYLVQEAENGEKALMLARSDSPDAVILDVGLPDMHGFDVLRRLREWLNVPVIVLSALGREQDKVAALDIGADDYLTKPFGVKELLARIRVALRNSARRTSDIDAHAVFKIGELTVDRALRRVFLAGEPVRVTPTEYKLLAVMSSNPGKVLTHRYLLTEVWGQDQTQEVQYLRVFMAGLRRKLEADPAQPRYLLTEPGVGYRMADE
jgi:two-component system KDP operon response regulator KdpE